MAEDGFGALSQLRTTLPEVIVCDLEMPRMTGVELLSAVRRRFPQILTVAMSGSYAGDELPPGVIADGYFAKGGSPRSLSTVVEQLIRSAPARGDEQPQESALA